MTVRRAIVKPVVPWLIVSLILVHTAGLEAQSQVPAKAAQTQGTTALLLRARTENAVTVDLPTQQPIRQAMMAEARSMGVRAQAPGAAVNRHECGWGVFSLVDGVAVSLLYSVGESNKRPEDPTQLKPFSAVMVVLGAVLAALGARQMIQHCGQPAAASQPVSLQPAMPLQPAVPLQPAAAPVVQTMSADQQAARQAIEEILRQPHGTIPPAQRVGRASGGTTTAAIQNGTPYSLSVYLLGPDSRTLTLQPSETRNLGLPPGSYQIGARVAAAGISPFYGEWTLEGGFAYSGMFYIAAQ